MSHFELHWFIRPCVVDIVDPVIYDLYYVHCTYKGTVGTVPTLYLPTLKKNEETRLEAFEMKGLRKIWRGSWTAKKTNE